MVDGSLPAWRATNAWQYQLQMTRRQSYRGDMLIQFTAWDYKFYTLPASYEFWRPS